MTQKQLNVALIVGAIVLFSFGWVVLKDDPLDFGISLSLLVIIGLIPVSVITIISSFSWPFRGTETQELRESFLRRACLIAFFVLLLPHLFMSYSIADVKQEFDKQSVHCYEDVIYAQFDCSGRIDNVVSLRNQRMRDSHFINIGLWRTNSDANTKIFAHLFVPGIKWIK